MNRCVTAIAIAAAIAAAVTATAKAQWAQQDSGSAADAMVAAAIAALPQYGSYGYATYRPPICLVRREQFTDEYGWRVRNVLVCY
jgi:hypothetical protein